jgi:flagellar basal body-associated protein FliL
MAKLSKQKKGSGEQDMTRNIIIGVSIAVALVAGGAGAFALIKRNQMKKESMSNAEL